MFGTGLTLDQLARRLRCAECGGPLHSVKSWRQTDASGPAIKSVTAEVSERFFDTD
jgi:hypothetical protein